jgi:bacterioferritin-associated ferredoxin
MVICICEAIGEREVDSHIDRGVSSVRELKAACGAGGDCGACVRELRERIRSKRCQSGAEQQASK